MVTWGVVLFCWTGVGIAGWSIDCWSAEGYTRRDEQELMGLEQRATVFFVMVLAMQGRKNKRRSKHQGLDDHGEEELLSSLAILSLHWRGRARPRKAEAHITVGILGVAVLGREKEGREFEG